MSSTPALNEEVPALLTQMAGTPPEPRIKRSASRLVGFAKRLGGSLAVILSVVTITFLVTRVFAPDPTDLFLGPSGNGFTSPEAAAIAKDKVRAALGLDQSIVVQYFHFLGQLLQGDLGTSFQTGRSVSADLLSKLPATAELAVYSLLIGVTLGIVVGVISAVYRGGIFDRIARFLTIGALAMPQFWIGLMLLWVFYTTLHAVPGPIGRLPLGVAKPPSITGFYVIDGVLSGQWATAWDAIRQLVLPVATLALGLAAPICKVVRTSMVEGFTSDYIRTATAYGFGRRRIWLVYGLKNGLLPVLTILAGVVAYTFTGSVLVEGIFGWPGVGNYSLQAIRTSDFPAVQGFVIYAAVLYVVVYEVLNSVYAVVDPRARA